MADSSFTPCLSLNIITISFVEMNAHKVDPISFPWPLPCCGIGSFPYARSDLPKPVFIWFSASCSTLNIAWAVSPATYLSRSTLYRVCFSEAFVDDTDLPITGRKHSTGEDLINPFQEALDR